MTGSIPHPQNAYFEYLEPMLRPGLRWLDVGCGRRLVPDFLRDHAVLEARLRACGATLVGIDRDPAALRNNCACTYLTLGSALALPFAPRTYDLVTSNMVFEHLPRPIPALLEIRRVLRPGGRLIVHTPSLFGIRSIAARLIPNGLHPLIVERIERRAEPDVHPTHFAFNRRGQVERALRAAGFARWRLAYLDSPRFYGELPLIGQLEALWDRLARRAPMLRPTMLVEAEAC